MIPSKLPTWPLAVLALAAGACDRGLPTAPDLAAPAFDSERAGAPALGALTWNVYVGAPIEQLLEVSDPSEIPFAVARLFAHVQATNFPERAEAIADRIADARPHLIGLQEVSLFRVQSPGDVVFGNPRPAETPILDYLAILQDALAARGLEYKVAAVSENFDVELPIVNFETGGLDDIRLTDFDVILVRSDVESRNAQSSNYAAALPVEIGGQTLQVLRGWASVDVRFKGRTYRFVNTHLEPADVGPGGMVVPELEVLQVAQAAELLTVADASPYPVILVGDLNSDDDGSTTPTYGMMRDAGFVDAWLVGRPRGPGYTSNQAPDLRNESSELFHRIDFVLYRDDVTRRSGHFPGAVEAELVGADPADRTSSGLWPSDHAGVHAVLRIAPSLAPALVGAAGGTLGPER